ncbi:MAG: type II secretion system GspH family protein, partial [Planctomycetota bacterium]|nr:type II secretion system GspH family protein [Planctomycetota bacterium]
MREIISDNPARREIAAPIAPPKGFTVVEILIVIAIISLLAAMLLPVLRDALDEA